MEERRRYPRVNALIRYRKAGGPARPAKEISRGGLGVFAAEPLEVGESLELDLFFPDSTGVSVAAKVAWVEQLDAEGKRFHAGLCFVAADEASLAKVDEFVVKGLQAESEL